MKFNIFDLLLPRETKFFDYFDQQIDTLILGSQAFKKMVVDLDKLQEFEIKTRISEIKDIETKGDVIEHQIIDELHQSFITPFDREDIHLMAVNIDRALDIINSSAQKIDMYGIRKVPTNIVNFADIIMEMCLELQKLMKQFKNKKKVEEMVAKLHNFENKGDFLFRISLADLFNNGTNAIEIIKFKEIYEHLEDLTDCLDFIGKTVRGIAVKQG
ncbi:MAG TPA: DUF47 family protein [bacterium]|nr:DUF47 family protein [bacterium]HPS29599.1 DUF47 family protein [bacterium]